jgi:O-succinylhomoserine sulfhydrylase
MAKHDFDPTGLSPKTLAVRGGLARTEFGETSEALFMNSGFVYDSAAQAEARFKGDDDGFIYSRYGNPTVSMFEERLRLLEGAEACYGTASGMAAVNVALMAQLEAGDHVVASRALFGSCHFIITQLLPRYGIETVLVDGTDLEQWRDAITDRTKAVFFETPSNPTLQLIDIEAVSELAHSVEACVIVDNVFSTPLLQRPMEFGADVVIYSGTKHIDGQGRCLGGAVLGTKEFIDEKVQPLMRHTGPALSPFNAWLLLKGLETLDLRVQEQCRTAHHLAATLENHPAITRLIYPGLPGFEQQQLFEKQMSAGGTVFSFEIAGGKATAFRVLDSLRLVDISNNLGDAKSLVTHPATTTHRAMSEEDRAALGISEGFVRLSVGLEDEADLLADLTAALDTVSPRAVA